MEMKRIGIGNYLLIYPLKSIILKKSDDISYPAYHHFFPKFISRKMSFIVP